MQLIITEKAIAGQRIASLLADKNVLLRKEDAAQMGAFQKDGKDFVVIPLRGHISNVDFPRQFSYWLGTDLKQLTMAPIEYVGTEKEIIALLKKKAKDADSVIIATDADREGESIGVEALNYLRSSNPELKVQRAYFSAITPKDIQTAFSELGKVDFDFADSADARREIDLIWGAVLTRFVSLMSGKLGKDFLSVGRVQTPVLALIVDREKQRRAFKSQKYWVVSALFEKDAVQFVAEHKSGKLWEKETAEKIAQKKAEFGIVNNVQSKQRILEKPLPFNTTSFLRASTVLGLTAGEAMNIAETLYQTGFISYPRTDNQVYPPNLDLKQILAELQKVPVFKPLVEKILALPNWSASAGKETKDHPPVHPVTAAQPNALTEKQWKVYELVCRRFLATLAQEAVTLNTSVELLLQDEPFVANGQTILAWGWKEFYPYSTLKEVILPRLEKGDKAKLLDLKMEGKETLPPPRYSQSTLLKLMEDLGLGTKSTRHETLQKLYARKYILGLKAIEPSQVAFAVVDSLQKHCKKVTEPEMTAELEKQMDEIAVGKKQKQEIVLDSRNVLLAVLEELLKEKNAVASELRQGLRQDSVMGKCTGVSCGGDLLTRFGKTGKRFLGCSNYPTCTVTYPLPQKGKVVPLHSLCETCKAPMIRLFVTRSSFPMCVNMNCATKDEWKKKAAARKELAQNKPVLSAVPATTPLPENEKKRSKKKSVVQKPSVGKKSGSMSGIEK